MPKPQYGDRHRKIRASYVSFVASGKAVCWRCGKPIAPNAVWDLGHVDGDPVRYAGPEHARCNRGASSASGVRKTSRAW
jgi:hypothetical protein